MIRVWSRLPAAVPEAPGTSDQLEPRLPSERSRPASGGTTSRVANPFGKAGAYAIQDVPPASSRGLRAVIGNRDFEHLFRQEAQ
jgi:hypothetical protein